MVLVGLKAKFLISRLGPILTSGPDIKSVCPLFSLANCFTKKRVKYFKTRLQLLTKLLEAASNERNEPKKGKANLKWDFLQLACWCKSPFSHTFIHESDILVLSKVPIIQKKMYSKALLSWVGLGSTCYLSCLDSCLQRYVLRKIKTARFMLCLS